MDNRHFNDIVLGILLIIAIVFTIVTVFQLSGNAGLIDRQREASRCSQWFTITELNRLVAAQGAQPVPTSIIPVPDISGLDCKTLLTETIGNG